MMGVQLGLEHVHLAVLASPHDEIVHLMLHLQSNCHRPRAAHDEPVAGKGSVRRVFAVVVVRVPEPRVVERHAVPVDRKVHVASRAKA